MRLKTSSIISLGFLFVVLQAQKCNAPQELYHVNIHFTTTEAYCGGAPPIDEILEELATPKNMVNTPLYFYNEDGALVLSTISNTEGVVVDSLPAGQYFIRKAMKTEMGTQLSDLDKCLGEWEQRVLDSIHVASDSSFNSKVYLDCNPCYPPAP